jgi:hypothetical protein
VTDRAPRQVNGLVLPDDLLAAIDEGLWSERLSVGRLREVFGEAPVHPRFYDLETIDAINLAWRDERREVYLGQPNDEQPPGDIDPGLSLLVAELGPDQLIALDYRRSPSSPGVVYLTEAVRSPWRQVAVSVDELVSRLTG